VITDGRQKEADCEKTTYAIGNLKSTTSLSAGGDYPITATTQSEIMNR
jgi:hypothetical protein